LKRIGFGSADVSCQHRNNDRRGDQVQSNQGDLAGGRVWRLVPFNWRRYPVHPDRPQLRHLGRTRW